MRRTWWTVLQLLASLYWRRLRRDVVTYNVDLAACQQSGRWQHAMLLLQDLEVELQSDVVSYNSIVSCADWAYAAHLLDVAQAKGVELDIVSTNACITVLGQHVAWVCWRKALQLLAQLEDQTLEKRIVTVNALINACEKSDQWPQAFMTLTELPRWQLRSSMVTMTSLISTYETCSEWQEALSLLDELKSNGMGLNAIAFNGVISACGKSHCWQQALNLFEEMQLHKLLPSVVSFNSCMMALAFGGRWMEALDLFVTSKVEMQLQTLVLRSHALLVAMEKGREVEKSISLLSALRADLFRHLRAGSNEL